MLMAVSSELLTSILTQAHPRSQVLTTPWGGAIVLPAHHAYSEECFFPIDDRTEGQLVQQMLSRQGEPPESLMTDRESPVALIVDDDFDTRQRVKQILQDAGYRAEQANCGEHALLLARELVPEVILLDLALPRMSGIDVLREVKSRQWADQPTAVVVVSFYAMLLHAPDLHLADAYVRKPFAPEDLLAQVATARCRMLGALWIERSTVLAGLATA
jgi:CheY-like chemotaxis protein